MQMWLWGETCAQSGAMARQRRVRRRGRMPAGGDGRRCGRQMWLPGCGPPAEDRASLAAVIAERVPAGATLIDIARDLGIASDVCGAIARDLGLRYKFRPVRPEEIAAVRRCAEEGMSVRATAAAVGISKSEVHRIMAEDRERVIIDAGSFRPRSVAPYRCPRHGRVTISPCTACEALAAMGRL